MKKLLVLAALAGAAVLVLCQAVPYGRNHVNPPVVSEPRWDSPATRALVKRACFDCHSNETVWPWYSRIAPASWLVYFDVVAARKKLNFSDWQNGRREGEDEKAIAHEVGKGEMPPLRYVLAHPGAKLGAAERQQLIDGLRRTLAPPAASPTGPAVR